MGNFDFVFCSEDTTTISLTPEEAVAAIVVVTGMASSNNQLDIETAATVLDAFDLFYEYSEEELSDLVESLANIADRDGLGAVFNEAYDSLSYEHVADAFAASFMRFVIEGEGELTDEEIDLICELQEALGFEDEEADKILDEVSAQMTAPSETNGKTGDKKERKFHVIPTDRDLGEIAAEVYDESADGGLYESPAGNFSVPVPADPQKGGRINPQEGSVAFSDDFGTLLRIDYTPFPAALGERIQLVGREEFFKSFLTNYVSEAILANFPGSKILWEEYIDDLMHGAYFIAVDMPHGSTISKQTSDGSEVPMNAYRGLVSFLAVDFVYTVSSQRHFLDGETPGLLEEEIEDIKNNIFDFIETIEFA